MTQLDWDDYMSVGIEDIDRQHKDLTAAINRLYEAVIHGDESKIPAARQRALDDLQLYVDQHFLTEESFLEEVAYPALEEHRALHRDFSRQVESFRADLQRGNLLRTADLVKTMLKWFREHLLEEDRKYADFLSRLPR